MREVKQMVFKKVNKDSENLADELFEVLRKYQHLLPLSHMVGVVEMVKADLLTSMLED